MSQQDPNPEQSTDPIVQISNDYYQESWFAKRQRMLDNADNFNCYHLKQDYSHKKAGQSKEFLPKVQNSVEQITNFLKQGIMKEDKWFEIGYTNVKTAPQPGEQPPYPTNEEIFKLVNRSCEKTELNKVYPDAIKLGLLGSLMIAKIHPVKDTVPSFFVDKTLDGKNRLNKRTRSVYRTKVELIRQEDWYPDPTARGLYEMHEIECDWHELDRLAKANPKDYDMAAVKACYSWFDDLQRHKKSRETDQNVTYSSFRRQVKIREFWGTIIQPGTGEVLHENVVWAVANGMFLIRPPTPNPFWHQESPFVVAPLVRVPFSVWHKAVMDSATKLNRAINELFNLMFDSAMMSTFGIKQLKVQYLEDPTEVEDGINPGMTIRANSSCPPGEKVLEVVQTGGTPQESINIFNLTGQEYNSTALTNDIRQGVLPPKEVKATEIQSGNDTLNGIFNGVVETIETDFSDKVLEKIWQTDAQYLNDLDTEEVRALLGDDRAAILSALSPEERFAKTVLGRKFKTFGMSQLNNKVNDFRKLTSVLQTIASNPMLVQEFSKKYSFAKLLTEIIRSLDIDTDKILNTPNDPNQAKPQDLANMVLQNNNPNINSQTPQAASMGNAPPGTQPAPQRMGNTNPGGNG